MLDKRIKKLIAATNANNIFTENEVAMVADKPYDYWNELWRMASSRSIEIELKPIKKRFPTKDNIGG